MAATTSRRRGASPSTTTITARIPESVSAALQALSVTSDKPVGTIVREAIEDYLLDIDPDKLLDDLRVARRKQAEEQEREDALALEAFSQARDAVSATAVAPRASGVRAARGGAAAFSDEADGDSQLEHDAELEDIS